MWARAQHWPQRRGSPSAPWYDSASPPTPGNTGHTGGKQLKDYLSIEVSFFSHYLTGARDQPSVCKWHIHFLLLLEQITTGQGIKTTQMYCFTLWRSEVWYGSYGGEIKVSAGLSAFWSFLGRLCFLPLLAARGRLHSLARGSTASASVSIAPSLTFLPPSCKHPCDDHPNNQG